LGGDGMQQKSIFKILEKYSGKNGDLLFILQEIQQAYGYLPEKSLKIVSEVTGRTLADIYNLIHFHDSFKLISPKLISPGKKFNHS
jgi:NADH:ubiquinone oxidoreductase subunit E